MTLQEQIGQEIKAARKAKGLTQKELAELLSTDEFRVSRMESGKTGLTIKTIDKIASALGVKFALVTRT